MSALIAVLRSAAEESENLRLQARMEVNLTHLSPRLSTKTSDGGNDAYLAQAVIARSIPLAGRAASMIGMGGTNTVPSCAPSAGAFMLLRGLDVSGYKWAALEEQHLISK